MSRDTAMQVEIDHDARTYEWSPEAKERIDGILKKYPPEQKQSAILPVLHLAQEEFDGWLPVGLMNMVADTLDMPKIRVYEVATFYDMFFTQPVGKHIVRVCTNISCMVRGSTKVMDGILKELKLEKPGTTDDKLITVQEFECMGACCEAPMMMIDKHYHVNLTSEKAAKIMQDIQSGNAPQEASK